MSNYYPERRFDYNINLEANQQFNTLPYPPRYSISGNTPYARDMYHHTSSTTPAHRKADLNATAGIPFSEHGDQRVGKERQKQGSNQRARAVSSSGYKRNSVDRHQEKQGVKVQFYDDARDKKVFLGRQPYPGIDFEQINMKRNHIQKSIERNGRLVDGRQIQQRQDTGVKKYDGSKMKENIDTGNIPHLSVNQKVRDIPKGSGIQNQISQKQIIQKIKRINMLNEEINNRLQRMLQRVDKFNQ